MVLQDLLGRFLLNVLPMLVLILGIYYPRYRHKETAIAAALFNVFAFAALSVLATVQFGIAAGFGLFAVLALFNLRSEQISKTDIAYFFGSIAIAVITSIPGPDIRFVATILVLALLAAYIIDHPRVLPAVSQTRLTLDHIPERLVSDPQALDRKLSERLGVDVLSTRVKEVDYVREIVRLEVNFRVREPVKSLTDHA